MDKGHLNRKERKLFEVYSAESKSWNDAANWWDFTLEHQEAWVRWASPSSGTNLFIRLTPKMVEEARRYGVSMFEARDKKIYAIVGGEGDPVTMLMWDAFFSDLQINEMLKDQNWHYWNEPIKSRHATTMRYGSLEATED